MKKPQRIRVAEMGEAARVAEWRSRPGGQSALREPERRAPTPLAVLKEYTAETTLHGLRYITKDDIGLCDRHLNATMNSTLKSQLWDLMSALSLFQHPFYVRMDHHLFRIPSILPLFNDFNMSDFMLKVLPTCEEVFHSCFWHGQYFPCCDRFHLQRSEAGFCYSFNSLTSENANCSTEVDMLATGFAAGNVPRKEDANCLLRRNTAAGTTTGLEFFMRPSDDANQLGDGQRDGKGVRILLHHPSNFPEAGKDMFVPERRENDIAYVFTIKVSPSVTISTPAVRNLDPYDRNCFFPDERRLVISRTYSLYSCLIECRLQYIAEHCHCHPYFFDMHRDLPECNVSQLLCISQHSVDMRFFSAPSDTLSFQEDDAKLRCMDCLPTCHEILFNMDSSFTEDSNPGSLGTAAYTDVYYKDLGAVKYRRDVAFGSMQLLVSFGGIVGLFLGVSLLSGVELLYYVTRLLMALYVWLRRDRVEKVEPVILASSYSPDIISHISLARHRGFAELDLASPKRLGGPTLSQ